MIRGIKSIYIARHWMCGWRERALSSVAVAKEQRAVRVEVGLKSSCAHGIGECRVVQLDSGRRVSIARVGSKWGGEKGLIVKKSWSKTSPKPCIISKYVDTTCRNYVSNGWFLHNKFLSNHMSFLFITYKSHLFMSWFLHRHDFFSKNISSSLLFNCSVTSSFCLVGTLINEDRNHLLVGSALMRSCKQTYLRQYTLFIEPFSLSNFFRKDLEPLIPAYINNKRIGPVYRGNRVSVSKISWSLASRLDWPVCKKKWYRIY